MNKTKRLVFSALLCALCCVGTMIYIPAGPTLGYIHLGDVFVILSAMILGPVSGGLAAACGSALADLINGYAIWVPATFVVKGLCAAVSGIVFDKLWIKKEDKTKTSLLPTVVFAGVCGEVLMIVGYFLYEIGLLLLSSGSDATLGAAISGAALSIPFNSVQAMVAIILTTILLPILLRIHEIRILITKQQ